MDGDKNKANELATKTLLLKMMDLAGLLHSALIRLDSLEIFFKEQAPSVYARYQDHVKRAEKDASNTDFIRELKQTLERLNS
jgi:hypothetical protein